MAIRFITLIALVALGGLSACNTIKGAGQDVSGGGQAISSGASSVQDEIFN